MKVATLEKFHLRGGGYQDPGDSGVGKVRGGRGFFPFKQGEGRDWPWMILWLKIAFVSITRICGQNVKNYGWINLSMAFGLPIGP